MTLQLQKQKQKHYLSCRAIGTKKCSKNELAFVTKPMKERDIQDKIGVLESKGVTIASTIRVGDL